MSSAAAVFVSVLHDRTASSSTSSPSSDSSGRPSNAKSPSLPGESQDSRGHCDHYGHWQLWMNCCNCFVVTKCGCNADAMRMPSLCCHRCFLKSPVLTLSAQLLRRRLGFQVVGTTWCNVADRIGPLPLHMSGCTSCTVSIQPARSPGTKQNAVLWLSPLWCNVGFTSSITGLWVCALGESGSVSRLCTSSKPFYRRLVFS